MLRSGKGTSRRFNFWPTTDGTLLHHRSKGLRRDVSKGDDWILEHEHMLEELAHKHQVYGSFISETTFEIVECLAVV